MAKHVRIIIYKPLQALIIRLDVPRKPVSGAGVMCRWIRVVYVVFIGAVIVAFAIYICIGCVIGIMMRRVCLIFWGAGVFGFVLSLLF